MANEIMFVADYFVEHIARGAEQDDQGVIEVLNRKNIDVHKIQSHNLSYVDPDKFYVISNFTQIPAHAINRLIEHRNYIIYEHDFKYAPGRNPGAFKNSIVNKDDLINEKFYAAAKRVVCCTSGQRDIFLKSMPELNYEVMGLSVYTDYDLDTIKDISCVPAFDFSIYSPDNSIVANQKGVRQAVEYCKEYNKTFTLVKDKSNKTEFLTRLGQGSKLLFLPQIYESCSRIMIEALMMGIGVEHNGQLGAASESLFNGELVGAKLIEKVKETQDDRVMNSFGINEYL